MISEQSPLSRDSNISNIKALDLNGNYINGYYVDVTNECFDDHRKCIGEYTNHQLKTLLICYCKCHKKKIGIDEILQRLKNNNSNLCPECGNNHNYDDYQNKTITSFDIFQEILNNSIEKQAMKNSVIEVIA
jgi:hypothetical protein